MMADSKQKKIRSLVAKEVAANRPKAGPHGVSKRTENKRKRKQGKAEAKEEE